MVHILWFVGAAKSSVCQQSRSSRLVIIIINHHHTLAPLSLVPQVAPSSGLITGVIVHSSGDIFRAYDRRVFANPQVAPSSGLIVDVSGGAIFRTNTRRANKRNPDASVIRHLLDSHQQPLGFTPKACIVHHHHHH